MICRLTSPHALSVPVVRKLAEQACVECGVDPQAGADHIAGLCGHWNVLVALAVENEEPVGLLVCELPNPFMLQPLISLAYNSGSLDLGTEMFATAREFITGEGYTRVTMLNRSRAPTDIWARGVEIRLRAKEVERASMITVELGQDERGRQQR